MRFINTRIFLFLHAILAFTAFAEARFSHLKRGGPCEVSVKGKTTQLQIPTLIAHKTSNIRSSGAQKEAMIQALAVATGTPIQTIRQNTERDCYMTAQEAQTLGLIDEILLPNSPRPSGIRP